MCETFHFISKRPNKLPIEWLNGQTDPTTSRQHRERERREDRKSRRAELSLAFHFVFACVHHKSSRQDDGRMLLSGLPWATYELEIVTSPRRGLTWIWMRMRIRGIRLPMRLPLWLRCGSSWLCLDVCLCVCVLSTLLSHSARVDVHEILTVKDFISLRSISFHFVSFSYHFISFVRCRTAASSSHPTPVPSPSAPLLANPFPHCLT